MGLEKISFNNQLPTGNSISTKTKQELPIGMVDAMADALVEEFANPEYRRWYCGVIYEFGLPKVEEWRRRAGEGSEPGKLFSMYVKHARTYKPRGSSP